MATITINIPSAQVSRVVNALSIYGGYNPTQQTVDEVTGVKTPTDAQLAAEKNEFARVQVIKFVKNVVLDVERREAISSATSSISEATVT